ncbi:MAG: 5-formyltetrahydrofolate cyclo-ligase [Chlorobi bacterium]|nr:5-formyltetrahydrofolate cyclo-ligase [Chlorobiota bacterium]
MHLKTLIPKSEARKLVVQRRNEVGENELRRKSRQIIERLFLTDEYRFAKTVHCYISSRPGEIDTRMLIDLMHGEGKSVVLPKLNKKTKSFRRFNFIDWNSIVQNSEGYWEPKLGMDDDLCDVDLIIVPALAVSQQGFRIGYGGGYYDKLLGTTFAPKFVLAFEFQLFEYIETANKDPRIDKIITERRIITTRKV